VRRPARDILLDTGPLVAALDRSDQWHTACAAAVEELVTRCITTEAVVTEACHLVSRGRARASLVIDFLLAADVPVLALDAGALRHAARLMDRYAAVPMDFADASLVVLAQALDLSTTLSTDRRGFSAYRATRAGAFRLLPERA
jgi:predicted nucleic acid-binding protein